MRLQCLHTKNYSSMLKRSIIWSYMLQWLAFSTDNKDIPECCELVKDKLLFWSAHTVWSSLSSGWHAANSKWCLFTFRHLKMLLSTWLNIEVVQLNWKYKRLKSAKVGGKGKNTALNIKWLKQKDGIRLLRLFDQSESWAKRFTITFPQD